MRKLHPAAVQGVEALDVLRDPVRRSLYSHVASSDTAVDRDNAASALGIARGLAAFHLDKLVAAGLLRAETATALDRRGPGRPRKLYRHGADVLVSVPPRNYRLLGRVLGDAVGSRWRSMKEQVASAARGHGALAGTAALRRLRGERSQRRIIATVVRELGELGYMPKVHGARIELTNCPFKGVAADRQDEICHLNGAFLAGFSATFGKGVQVDPQDPTAVGCCASLRVTD